MGQQLADMLKRAGREAPSQALGRDLAFASRQLLKVGSCGQVAPLPPKCPSSRAPPFLWACVSLRSALLSLGEKHSDLLRGCEPYQGGMRTLPGSCRGPLRDPSPQVWPGCHHPGQPVSQLLWLQVITFVCQVSQAVGPRRCWDFLDVNI